MTTASFEVNKRAFVFSTNSRAHELYVAKKHEELKKHLLDVEKEALKLQGDPTGAIAALRQTMASRGFIIPT